MRGSEYGCVCSGYQGGAGDPLDTTIRYGFKVEGWPGQRADFPLNDDPRGLVMLPTYILRQVQTWCEQVRTMG